MLFLQVNRRALLRNIRALTCSASAELCDLLPLMSAALASFSQGGVSHCWHLSVFLGHAVWSSQQVTRAARCCIPCERTFMVGLQLLGEVARGDWALGRADDVRDTTLISLHFCNI
jgi:hypothetical protein